MVAALFMVLVASAQKRPLPDNDSLDYLGYARSMVMAGTYAATPLGPARDGTPGREPMYSSVIALAGYLLPGVKASLVGCWPLAEGCRPGLMPLYILNALLVAGAATLVLLSCRDLGCRPPACLGAGLYVLLNFQMHRELKYVVSDFLAVFLLALVVFLLGRAWRRPSCLVSWGGTGMALAMLALTKGMFLPLIAVAGVVALVRARLICALALAVMAAAPVSAWAMRNHALFGVISDDRGAIALSTREMLTHMTPSEHLAAFLWWTRGPGDDLARRLLPQEAWRRHDWYVSDGFYQQGQFVRHQRRVDALMAEQGLSPAIAQSAAAGVTLRELVAQWPEWLATMPVLIYRGLWCDEFVVLGFPALVWLSWVALRTRRWAIGVASLPGWWSLLAYAAFSLNIPRYQLTAIPTMALASSFALDALWQRWQRGKHMAQPGQGDQ